MLRLYDTLRPPRANKVLRMSARAGELYHAYGPELKQEQVAEALSGIWDPIWHVDLAKEVKDALTGLQRIGV